MGSLRELFYALQAVRSDCEGCTACDGFEIWFRAADANDPNVMLFCSRCGCASDKHIVDQASCATPKISKNHARYYANAPALHALQQTCLTQSAFQMIWCHKIPRMRL